MNSLIQLAALAGASAIAALAVACSTTVEQIDPVSSAATSSSTAATTSSSSGDPTTTTTTGGGGATGGSSSGVTGGGGAGGDPHAPYPGPHPSFPQIPDHGGKPLHDPVIVTVTFDGDPLVATIQKFDDEVGSLQWWSAVHASYGVGPATSGGHVVVQSMLPATMTGDDVSAWVVDRVTDGTFPAPTDQTIYAIYPPVGTSITLSGPGGGALCSQFLGYHDSTAVVINGVSIPTAYAILGQCSDTNELTVTASHEFTEASTDPHPTAGPLGYALLTDTAWTVAGGEDGDMCSGVSSVTEAGWSLTRVWNNPNAKLGQQPCVPVPVPTTDADVPYFNAGILKDTIKATPGQTLSLEVECYSFGPLPNPMTLTAQAFSGNTYLGFTFDKPTCLNGDKVTMTVSVGKNVTVGQSYHYQLLSEIDATTSHLWRGMITIN